MGLLVDGRWHTDWYDTESTGGKFVRKASSFRSWVTPNGDAGTSGVGGFNVESGRYHLYVSLACPWAHRTLVFRELKGLQDMISLSAVNAFMGDEGWTFDPGDSVIEDTVNHATRMHEIYTLADPEYTGRVTVPVLWDKKRDTIVSNESADIIRMFNSAFDDVGAKPGDYYPEDKREQIDELNTLIYDNINNGVYMAGFATTQNAYLEAVTGVFRTLDELEQILAAQPYLAGSRVTEADWRLFTTLIRFDSVYYGHFKSNLKRIIDYPALSRYLRGLLEQNGVADTVDIEHIKAHYYGSHRNINPTGIVPLGPESTLLC